MIDVTQLTKRYGGRAVVDSATFACRPGTVTGFLGPNGAGKSTTLRMICGLTHPSSGMSRVADRPFRDLPNPGRKVGLLLDASAQHNGRTGREVLTLAAMTMGVPRSRVDEVLVLVGLDQRAARKRMRAYSLGMRQRLGVAVAVLGDPDVLILDEPANGLDPEGVAWMRGLLREFADRGGTVLLSSHLLLEVEALADHIVVINAGRIVADGDKKDLLAGTGTLVRGRDPDQLANALRAVGLEPSRTADGALLVPATLDEVAVAAAAAGVLVTELRAADGSRLEHVFLDLVEAKDAVR